MEANKIEKYQQPLERLRDLVPGLVDLLRMEEKVPAEQWKNLDTRLLPLLDKRLPLMVAICGGANSGKSTLFNSLLKVRLSLVRGDAGSTRRVLAAVNPGILALRHFMENLFEPFGSIPQPLDDPKALRDSGPPLYLTHPQVPPDQVWMDTPDFDTGSQDRYLNRHIAREVLEACNVLVYIVTNTTYNNLENTRFMRQILTEAGLRRCILVYNCSRTLEDSQALGHLEITATNLYGESRKEYLIGYYRTDTSDAVASGENFMSLRPVRKGDPELMDLLRRLDPREIREKQIQTTLSAFTDYVRQVLDLSRATAAEVELYAGTLQLVLGRAVQQALVSIPVKKIMQRMNDLWLETSPPHLKFFRGVGTVIGKPARMILSLIKQVQEGEKAKEGMFTKALDPLEEIQSNLLGAASELRDHLLAEEVIAEAIAKDPQGSRLTELTERIRAGKDRRENQLPFRQPAASTGTVIFHVAAPACTQGLRKNLSSRPWSAVSERLLLTAREILQVAEDARLTAELTDLIHEFREQMNFFQKTRESFFASLNVLPATLGIAYILTTGDPVGGSGIYAKLQGLFGMHDLWALVSVPASAGLDETGRKQLAEMLEPVVKRWLENRAVVVRNLFKETLSGELEGELAATLEKLDSGIEQIEAELKKL
ncbi:MAG: GTPase [Thermodesulfobacteriota bacterium]